MTDDAAVRAATEALESVWGLIDDPEGFAITAVAAARPIIEAEFFRQMVRSDIRGEPRCPECGDLISDHNYPCRAALRTEPGESGA